MPQLLIIVSSVLTTAGVLLFRIGQLEGRVMQQLRNHEERLERLEQPFFVGHGRV